MFKQIKVVSFETQDLKQYKKCVLPRVNIFIMIINFCVLGFGLYLSYSLRVVDQKYKENLVIPIYVYILFTTIIEIFNFNDDISVIVQDLIGSIGTIITNSVTLLYLFIFKFYSIYVHRSIELNRSRSSSINNDKKNKPKFLADIAPDSNIKRERSTGSMNLNRSRDNSSDSIQRFMNNKWPSNSADNIPQKGSTLWKSLV